MPKILVIDDDPDMCLLLRRFLLRHQFDVVDVTSGKKALQWLETNKPELILCDLRLEDMNGSDVLAKVKGVMPEVPFIIITGYSDVKTAVDVMKLGAYDYVTKPLFPDEILVTIKQALDMPGSETQQQPPTSKNKEETTPAQTKESQQRKTSFQRGKYIFGNSIIFQQILRQIELVAPTNYSVIIYGESGSGKEAIASEIHNQSKRSNQPFVAIDCGALNKELAASELFGHEKGSFTGALNQKSGSFELANGGTIFLDEIANLSYEVQVSLLRVVQERKMRRVGGVKDIDLDVRIIVASNEKLWDISRKGKFREDLFHRFNEFSINVPPLRERKEDIEIFAAHFLQITNNELGKQVKGFSKEVMDIFKNYVWFGNLREMKNVVKRATLLTDGDYIEVISLPFEISNHYKLNPISEGGGNEREEEKENSETGPDSPNTQGKVKAPTKLNLKSASIDAEFETIMEALKKVNFNKSKAAQLLNIDRKTLYNKMKEYQLINNEQHEQ